MKEASDISSLALRSRAYLGYDDPLMAAFIMEGGTMSHASKVDRPVNQTPNISRKIRNIFGLGAVLLGMVILWVVVGKW